jgi:hypothetical protein
MIKLDGTTGSILEKLLVSALSFLKITTDRMNHCQNFVQTRQERHNGCHYFLPNASDEGSLGDIKECVTEAPGSSRVDEIYVKSYFVNDFIKGVQNVAQLKCDETCMYENNPFVNTHKLQESQTFHTGHIDE